MSDPKATFSPASFADLPAWDRDDHLAALRAFQVSCERIGKVAQGAKPAGRTPPTPDMQAACAAAAREAAAINTTVAARTFFERNFAPHRVVHAGAEGLLTGYYEPLVEGSRSREGRFTTPIYRRPPDLVNLVEESQRGSVGSAFTHARKTGDGLLVPFPSRAEIDQGALDGKGLELLYLADPVDVFFLQVQGSGRVKLRDGTIMRVQYDGKNGHPYRSLGRHLIATGAVAADRMSMQALAGWLRADRRRGQAAMWHNASYVFFRELRAQESTAPLGVLEIPLVTGRSLAVDPSVHAIGTPIYVTSAKLTHAGTPGGFHRLMVAHDVGSAIKGAERADIYFGTGEAAGKIAGVTRHPGNLLVLLPRAASAATPPAGPSASSTSSAKK